MVGKNTEESVNIYLGRYYNHRQIRYKYMKKNMFCVKGYKNSKI